MKISASILAVQDNYMEYARQLKYSNVDYLHIDIFQESENFAIDDLLKFNDTFLPLDIHLIFHSFTERDFEILNSVNAAYISIQYETLSDKDICIKLRTKVKGRLGLAITAETPLTVVDQNKDYITHVLFMCSEPGISGAKFDERNFERIKKIHSEYPNLFLIADGGINDIIAEKMGKCGINMVVSGSYLCKNLYRLGANAYTLKYLNEHNIKVERSMIPISGLPVLSKEATFEEIINKMNKYRLGVVFVEDDGKFKGIVSDGDIRRAFIKYEKNIFEKKATDILNPEPYVSDRDKTIEEIYENLSHIHKGIDIIPVVEDEVLLGALDLHMGL